MKVGNTHQHRWMVILVLEIYILEVWVSATVILFIFLTFSLTANIF